MIAPVTKMSLQVSTLIEAHNPDVTINPLYGNQ
jgi:hypothetical protein